MSHPCHSLSALYGPKNIKVDSGNNNPGNIVNSPLPAVVDYEILFAAQLTLAEHAMAHIGGKQGSWRYTTHAYAQRPMSPSWLSDCGRLARFALFLRPRMVHLVLDSALVGGGRWAVGSRKTFKHSRK